MENIKPPDLAYWKAHLVDITEFIRQAVNARDYAKRKIAELEKENKQRRIRKSLINKMWLN